MKKRSFISLLLSTPLLVFPKKKTLGELLRKQADLGDIYSQPKGARESGRLFAMKIKANKAIAQHLGRYHAFRR
jgi:hypothetical protein